jgi:hypothetical protein
MNPHPITQENPLSASPVPSRILSRHPRLLLAGGLALTAVVVSACGSSSSGTPAASSSAPASIRNANFSGVSGKVTSVAGAIAKVQSTSTTSSVTWGSATTFSKVSAVSLASLAKGDCVVVTNAGTTTGASAAVVTARTVSVTSTSGCGQGFGTGGPGGGGGAPGGGFGSASPGGGASAFPRPTGSPGSGGGFGGGGGFSGGGSGVPRLGADFGTVDSVAGSSLVLTSRFASRTVKVKITSSTTISATSATTSSALVTGACASAVGLKASDGTIDARTITISAPSNGKCTAVGEFAGGFPGAGGFQGRRPGFGASPGATNA